MIEKIKVLDGGKGRVPNPHPKTILDTDRDDRLVDTIPNPEWLAFDKANPAYDIIGPLSVKVGDMVDATLVWQYFMRGEWRKLELVPNKRGQERYNCRQAWQLTPEKEGEEKPCPYVHTLEYLQNRINELENTTGAFIDEDALHSEINYYKNMIEHKAYKPSSDKAVVATNVVYESKIKEGDIVDFEYYTETDCKTGSGKILWINDNDCVVEDKNRKRHMMQISAINLKNS